MKIHFCRLHLLSFATTEKVGAQGEENALNLNYEELDGARHLHFWLVAFKNLLED
jgi:hypothetical protein